MILIAMLFLQAMLLPTTANLQLHTAATQALTIPNIQEPNNALKNPNNHAEKEDRIKQ